MPLRQRKRRWLSMAALATAAMSASPVLRAADLLRDDFSGTTLDTTNWSIGTWQLGRTQLGFTPAITGGMARPRHHTHNPGHPRRAFQGAENLSHPNLTPRPRLQHE